MSTSESARVSSGGRTAAFLIPAFVYAVLLAVGAGTVWEAVSALRPYDAGEDVLGKVAYLALLGGGAVFGAAALSARARRRFAAVHALRLVGVAAAGFVVAIFFSYDSYYAPDPPRYVDGRLFLAPWIGALVVVAMVLAVVARRRTGVVTPATAAIMWLSLVAITAISIGH